nr:uncharacterized protein LOC129415553 isoform X1 [Misgurnus anguillicaudatus]XP_055025544.1 uncharacterized protein LOC129415553 isoform X1 [Misgurnus anguillicaudatus]XP_055025545.1 uncharacterized protein LOC129415553 isoform X1 [Misgurnus anguillicaudatus]
MTLYTNPKDIKEYLRNILSSYTGSCQKNVLDLGSVLYKMLHGKKPPLWTPIMDPTLTKRKDFWIYESVLKPPVSSSNPSSKDSSDLASQSKVVKGGPEEPTSLIEDYLRRKKDVEHHVMLPNRADQAHPDATDKASLPISKTRVSLEGTDMHVRQSKYPMPYMAKNPADKVSKILGPESAGQRQKKNG